MLKLFLGTATVLGMLVGGPAADRPKTGNAPPQISTESVCPLIYQPVICDKGKVYPNLCVAEQHHAKNCVPYGV